MKPTEFELLDEKIQQLEKNRIPNRKRITKNTKIIRLPPTTGNVTPRSSTELSREIIPPRVSSSSSKKKKQSRSVKTISSKRKTKIRVKKEPVSSSGRRFMSKKKLQKVARKKKSPSQSDSLSPLTSQLESTASIQNISKWMASEQKKQKKRRKSSSESLKQARQTPKKRSEYVAEYLETQSLERKTCERDYQLIKHLGTGGFGTVYQVCAPSYPCSLYSSSSSSFSSSSSCLNEEKKKNCGYVMKIQYVKNKKAEFSILQELSIHRYLSKLTVKRKQKQLVPRFVDSWLCRLKLRPSSSSSSSSSSLFHFTVTEKWDGTLLDLLLSQFQQSDDAFSPFIKELRKKWNMHKFRVITINQLKSLTRLIHQLTESHVVHGDLNENNILYRSRSGSDFEFAVNDFGFATRSDDRINFLEHFQNGTAWNPNIPCQIIQSQGDEPPANEYIWEHKDELNMFQLESMLCYKKITFVLNRLNDPLTSDRILLGFNPDKFELKNTTVDCDDKNSTWMKRLYGALGDNEGVAWDTENEWLKNEKISAVVSLW